MIYKDFYAELGKLLYAVADVDGMISPEEKRALQLIIRNQLVPMEFHVDEFGTDTAYYSEIAFDFMDESITDAESAFESFVDFVDEHHTGFDAKMKTLCLYVVKELAAAYHGTNKKERRLIKQLETKLKAIKTRDEK